MVKIHNFIFMKLIILLPEVFTGHGSYGKFIIFKLAMSGLRPHAPGFLKLLWLAHQYVCLSVCPPPRALITSSMIWCDISHMRLVKQVLRLFPAFNYFI